MTAYFLMFGAAFLAATLLPFYSEVLVAGLAVDRPDEWVWIWLVATLGNTLGSAVNWLLGRYLLRYQDRKWFPFKADRFSRSQQWFQKYGVCVGPGRRRCLDLSRRGHASEIPTLLGLHLRRKRDPIFGGDFGRAGRLVISQLLCKREQENSRTTRNLRPR